MKKIDLSIVIVSFNTLEMTRQTILSVLDTAKGFEYEIIVVDNNSTDGSLEMLQELGEKNKSIIVIANEENLGFSKANNRGVKKSSGEYILFLNSDTMLSERTLEEMLGFMKQNPEAGVATCKLLLTSGEVDDASHRGFPTPWRSFCHFSGLSTLFPRSRIFAGYTLGWMDLSKTHEIEACAGAFMIVPRIVGEKIRWWDEDFFFYGEDLDFCYKVKELGYKIYYVPEFECLHYKGVSSGIKKISSTITHANNESKKRVIKERFRAMKLFYDKHYKKEYPSIVRMLIFVAIDAKYFLARRKI